MASDFEIRVEFVDPAADKGHWDDLETCLEAGPAVCVAVGFPLEVSESRIVLAQVTGNQDGDVEYLNRFQIPRGCVLAVYRPVWEPIDI